MKIPKSIIFDAGNTLLQEISYDIDKGIVKSLRELNVDLETTRQAPTTAGRSKQTSEFKLLFFYVNFNKLSVMKFCVH